MQFGSGALRRNHNRALVALYVGNRSAPGDISNGWTDEYDGEGKFVKTIKADRGLYSANCRYLLPLWADAVHGPSDWAVYDAMTQRRVLDLPCVENGKHDLHWFMGWNPRFDHLALVGATNPVRNWNGIEVLYVRDGTAVSAWEEPKDDAAPPLTWSGDGRSVVTVRNKHVVFDPLQQSVLVH